MSGYVLETRPSIYDQPTRSRMKIQHQAVMEIGPDTTFDSMARVFASGGIPGYAKPQVEQIRDQRDGDSTKIVWKWET